jgi:hypothetical protein
MVIPMRTRSCQGSFLPTLARAALLALLPGLAATAIAPPDSGWPAAPDRLAGSSGLPQPASFRLVQEGARTRLALAWRGRTVTADLPAAAATFVLPLAGRARLQVPWAAGEDRPAPAGPAWNLSDGRPAEVGSAASGVVRRVARDPDGALLMEVDHGGGLATRYRLVPGGRSALPPGARVAAGDLLGVLAPDRPDRFPQVTFEVRFEAGPGDWAVLDPAPFLFGAAVNRVQPVAGSVLNAAVRAGDGDQVARLLGLGLDPNRRAADGTGALEWAVMAGDAAMARLLVAAGGDPRAATAEWTGTYLEGLGMTIANHGPTILELARDGGDPDLDAVLAGK